MVAQGYLGVLELPVVVSELVQARAVGLAMPVSAVAVPALAAVDNMELAAQAEPEVELSAVIDKDKKEIADS